MTQKHAGKVQPRKQPLGVSWVFVVSHVLVPTVTGMEDFFPAPQAASVMLSLGTSGLSEQSC